MRVYSQERLSYMSNDELKNALDMVKTNMDLTEEEKKANIEMLELRLYGISEDKIKKINEDIKNGKADTSDMEGIQ